MGDRVSSFTITFDGEAGTVNSVLAALKSKIKSDVSDIQATADKLDVFGKLQQQAKDAAGAFFTTKQRVEDLRSAIDAIRNSGGPIGKDLTNSLKDAERAAASARKEFDSNRAGLTALRAELTKAGVDTRNLAAEQTRLATAAAEAAAKQTLGFKTLADVEPQIKKLQAAYNTLASSGRLSVGELTKAQSLLGTQITALRGQVSDAGIAARLAATDFEGLFTRSVLPALGFVGVIASVGAAFKSAIDASKEYRQSIGELGALTNVTDDDLGKLGDGVRAVARDLGLDLADAFKSVQELLRSGVPKDNVVDVLRVTAEAARAAFTDLGSGVKATDVLLKSFDVGLAGLPGALDKILRAAKEGGPTLKEFGDNGANLGNVAKALNLDFDSTLAVLTVLVDKEGDAGQAFGDLTRILAKLNTSEAREKLRGLGIDTGNLADIFTQLHDKGITLNQALDLGVVSTKSAAAIAALTTNAGELPAKLDAIAASAGTSQAALQRFLDSPAGRSARFNAELHDAEVTLGDLFGSGSRLAQLGTAIVGSQNRIADAFRNTAKEAPKASESFTDYLNRMLRLGPAEDDARVRLQLFGGAVGDVKDKSDRLVASIAKASDDLGAFSTKLAADVTALQSAAARDTGDIDARAAAQIAALDRTRAAIAASAAAQQEIEQKAAAARLAVIQKAEADITAALDKEIAARIALARKNGQDETKIAADSAQARIAALAPVLQQYQQHYNSLIAQAQRYAAQVESIDRSRVEIQRTIETEVRAIRLEGLSGLDQYVEKNKQINDLISEGRRAAAQGDVEAAKGFFDQAIQESKGLTEVVNADGVQIVTALQARTAKVDALKKISDAVNQSLGDQGDAAKKGLDKTKAAIEAAQGPLQDLQDRYDALKRVVGEGLQLKLALDGKSVSDALATINDVAKDRVVTIRLRTVDESGNPVNVPISQTPEGAPPTSTGGGNGEHFARGGEVRRFAHGGGVFSRPSWNKVPGSGSGDTVPALLNEGSFVVRKAASAFYGDGLMGRLARGYAAGGTVTKDQVRAYAESKWGFDPFSSSVYDPGRVGNRVDKGGTAPTGDQFGEFTTFHSGQSFQDKFEQRTISLDTRPIPDALITAVNVTQYAREMLNSVGQTNPLLGSLLPAIIGGIQAVERNPLDKASLTRLLQAAETIGSNPYLFQMWGKTTSSNALQQPEWFIDWLGQRGLVGPGGAPTGGGGGLPAFTGQNAPAANTFAQRFFGKTTNVDANNFALRFFEHAIPAAGPPPQLLELIGAGPGGRNPKYFDGGGASTDTVRAMLTPGEFVISKPAVDRIGAPLLWAINQMQLPKEDFSYMVDPPRIPRFATGGPVGGRTGGASSSSPVGAGPVTNLYMQLSVDDIFTEANIRRKFIPVWDNIQRRSRR